jgi:molybdopterin-guanine dinucleotide biosynthesis protein A
MPLLNTGLIEKLLKSFNPDKHDCLIPINSGRKEVLHAFYSKSITPLIEEKLEQNNLKIRSIFPSLRCRYVRLNREEKKYLLNINTKEDLARLY